MRALRCKACHRPWRLISQQPIPIVLDNLQIVSAGHVGDFPTTTLRHDGEGTPPLRAAIPVLPMRQQPSPAFALPVEALRYRLHGPYPDLACDF